MKKILFLFLILIFTSGLNAQITFTNNELAPEGTTFLISSDTVPGPNITIGAPGPDKLWDFSSAVEHEVDTFKFELPDWTPYPDVFPDANFAIEAVGDSNFVFLIRNDDEFSAIGVVGNFQDFGLLSAPIEPKEIIYDFPMQYGKTWDETFSIETTVESTTTGIDSLRIKMDTEKNTFVDAWGTMDLPLGSFATIRVKELRVVCDSNWAKIFGSWVLVSSGVDESTTYYWLTDDPTIGYTLVSLDYDTDNQTVDELNFINATPVGIEKKTQLVTKVFPNPTSGKVYFSFENVFAGEINIYDLQGQIISQLQLNSQFIELDISAFNAGVYIYQIFDENGISLAGGKLLKK